MTAHALVTGTIFRDPEQKSSARGTPFVAATLRVKDGDAVQWWKVLAFNDTAKAELMRLSDGEAISVQGSFKCDFYAPEGREPRVNLTLFADNVLALKQPPKERKPRADNTAPPPAAPDDPLPF